MAFDLNPCPFCGGRGDLDSIDLRDGQRTLYWVECRGDECGISGRICGTPEAAATFWNRRVPCGVPEGYVLVPFRPTPAMVDVMLTWGTKRSEWEMILHAARAADGVGAVVSQTPPPLGTDGGTPQ